MQLFKGKEAKNHNYENNLVSENQFVFGIRQFIRANIMRGFHQSLCENP